MPGRPTGAAEDSEERGEGKRAEGKRAGLVAYLLVKGGAELLQRRMSGRPCLSEIASFLASSSCASSSVFVFVFFAELLALEGARLERLEKGCDGVGANLGRV